MHYRNLSLGLLNIVYYQEGYDWSVTWGPRLQILNLARSTPKTFSSWDYIASSVDNSNCNRYTDREESENEKRWKKTRSCINEIDTPRSLPILSLVL